jgi:hypothetical protein
MKRIRLGALLSSVVIVNSFAGLARAVEAPGPDAFGYHVEAIPFDLRDVSFSGINVGLDTFDDSVALAPIGFSFPFYGQNYTQVEISTNGFITFTPTGSSHCCSGDSIPNPSGLNNFIAGWWEDLDPTEGGIIRRQTLGLAGARQFVVGYYQVRDNDDPENSINTMELILHEASGNIELQYGQIQFEDVDDKVVGIENDSGTDGIQILFMPSSAPFPNGHIVYQNQGFLISRIPEPSTAALAGAWFIALACRYRPRKAALASRRYTAAR